MWDVVGVSWQDGDDDCMVCIVVGELIDLQLCVLQCLVLDMDDCELVVVVFWFDYCDEVGYLQVLLVQLQLLVSVQFDIVVEGVEVICQQLLYGEFVGMVVQDLCEGLQV